MVQNKGKLFPAYANTAEGKEIRKQIQEGTLPESEWKKIPEKVRGVLRCAEACKSKLTGTKLTVVCMVISSRLRSHYKNWINL